MLDEMGKDIDAVTVSTPDHNHGVAAIRAMKMGKHCFCQKPLVQTVNEARIMRQLAKEKKLATQMGNQGSAENGLRRAVEVIQAGVIGNRSNCMSGPTARSGRRASTGPQGKTRSRRPGLGCCGSARPRMRPFKKDVYHTFKWRGWYDFGTGALGDMACHTVNMPFRALKLGYPNVVECEMASRHLSGDLPQDLPHPLRVPEREGLPPLKFWWYDGNPDDALKPLRPDAEVVKEIVATHGKLPGSGAWSSATRARCSRPTTTAPGSIVAMKGKKEYMAGDKHEACKAVPQTIPRSPGHMQEWFRMMKEGDARLLELRHRRLPDRDHPPGLRRLARRRRPAHGVGRPEHEVAQPARKRPSSSSATTGAAGASEPRP